ncbi:MAG: hypothetical protein WBO68_16190 [Pyrinomonadaceae bacterium]
MAMNVKIDVEGSVILYLKNDVWNLIFVTETCHNLKFTDPTMANPPEPLAKTNYPITIDFTASGTVQRAEWGIDELPYFMNMNDARLHGRGFTGQGFLVVDPKSHNNCQWVHVKVPFGVVKHSQTTTTDYYYRGYNDLGARDWIDPVTKGFTIEFDVKDGETLTMTSSDPLEAKPREYTANVPSLTLKFDNDCKNRIGYNDFVHFYDWVFDTRSPSRDEPIMFVAGKKSYLKVFEKDASDEKIKDFYLQVNKALMSPDGNCDPVVIEPPPGP